jgi:hypothetical protein
MNIQNIEIDPNYKVSDEPKQQQGGAYYKKSYNYKNRPTVTVTDTLQTMDKIEEQLKGYERVQNIDEVKIGTPVKYITWKYGKERFCVGGLLVAIKSDYCKLSNFKNDVHWNVKKKHKKNTYNSDGDDDNVFYTIFYQKSNNQGDNCQSGGDGSSGEPDVPIYNTMQAKEIEKFRKRVEKHRNRREWLSQNIHIKRKNKLQDFI